MHSISLSNQDLENNNIIRSCIVVSSYCASAFHVWVKSFPVWIVNVYWYLFYAFGLSGCHEVY